MRGYLRTLRRHLLLLALAGVLPSVAVSDDGRQDDPLISYNRAVFAFNDAADRWFLKPVAKGYRAITPNAVEKGVVRMFDNVGEVLNVVNDVLQGKFAQAGNDGGRFIVNSTIGLAGFYDVAEHWGLRKSAGEDFGQTLAVWGVNRGPYLVLPFLGPSTFRDAPGRAVDGFMNPVGYIDHVPTRNQIHGVDVLTGRAALLEAEKLVKGDRYTFVRDVYLQRREYLVQDGQVDDDFGDSDYQ